MKNSNWGKSTTIRLLSMGVVMIALFIPLVLVQNVIYEREEHQQTVYSDIASSWGHEEMVVGPILTIPYNKLLVTNVKHKDGSMSQETTAQLHHAHFMPQELNIKGELTPETLHRGIYAVPVYLADLHGSGRFSPPESEDWDETTEILWNEAFVSLSVSENQGIDLLEMSANSKPLDIRPGMRNAKAPLNRGVHALMTAPEAGWNFEFELMLKGSGSFSLAPIGSHTKVELSSTWTAPSFYGAFLPDGRSEEFSEGFEANWDILEINRAIPNQFSDSQFNPHAESFGVKLKEEISDYTKTERSTKYAILFIALIFVALMAVQLVRGQWLHPLQLGMLGLGLVLFYLLLLSLSEILGFNLAYLIAAIVMTAQMGWYLNGLFAERKATLACVGVLVVLYIFSFVLVQMVMYSLLVGSLGLVVALGVLMALSKKLPEISQAKAIPSPPIAEV